MESESKFTATAQKEVPIPAHNLDAAQAYGTPQKQTAGIARRIFDIVRNHPGATLRAVAVLLVAIVVLQNFESTSVDVLFWSIPDSPKIVVILVSMLLGALVWEVYRPASFRG